MYEDYRTARDRFDRQLKHYWRSVEAKRDARRAKYMMGQAYAAEDYVALHPPKYTGPQLPADRQIVTEVNPPSPEQPLATWRTSWPPNNYGFVPTLVSEREFKRRYAQEALAVGLTKDQVVRIYALETGGQGTYDMQSGFNPVTKTGRPISSALGYAQLLHANSTSELVKHGELFASRLQHMAKAPGTPPKRAAALSKKAAIVRRMLRAARSMPFKWAAHVKFAATPAGLGIHALNLDADVGPWLQVLKLKGLKDMPEKAGRGALSGAEIELMNLAGPRTGLEMMTPIGRRCRRRTSSARADTTAIRSCAIERPANCWRRSSAHGGPPQETRCRRVRASVRRGGPALSWAVGASVELPATAMAAPMKRT